MFYGNLGQGSLSIVAIWQYFPWNWEGELKRLWKFKFFFIHHRSKTTLQHYSPFLTSIRADFPPQTAARHSECLWAVSRFPKQAIASTRSSSPLVRYRSSTPQSKLSLIWPTALSSWRKPAFDLLLSSALLTQGRVLFLYVGYYVLVYLQGFFLHCVNSRQQEMLCHSLFLSGGQRRRFCCCCRCCKPGQSCVLSTFSPFFVLLSGFITCKFHLNIFHSTANAPEMRKAHFHFSVSSSLP